jgi:FkbM family methyltransferase
MRIFLDVGAHTGQTLLAAQRWPFDRIVCFEPVAANIALLRELADRRTTIEPYGLWNKTATAPIFDPGSQGGSLWKRPKRPHGHEMCQFVRAADWLDLSVNDGDQVWMKLNAEGAELDIITDMLDSGAVARLTHLLVMWDASKIPQIRDRLEAVQARLAEYTGLHVRSSKDIDPAKTHVGRIDNWLALTGLERP